MILESEVEKAVEYLRDNARRAAAARANRQYVEDYLKVIKAHLMTEHSGMHATVAAQERMACCDPKYEQHLKVIKDAVEQDEYHRWMMSAAEAKLSAWQTQCRIQRTQDGIR